MRELLTTRQAAERVNKAEATIRQWVTRGYLSPAGRVGRLSYYRTLDVLNAEKATRDRNRHSA